MTYPNLSKGWTKSLSTAPLKWSSCYGCFSGSTLDLIFSPRFSFTMKTFCGLKELNMRIIYVPIQQVRIWKYLFQIRCWSTMAQWSNSHCHLLLSFFFCWSTTTIYSLTYFLCLLLCCNCRAAIDIIQPVIPKIFTIWLIQKMFPDLYPRYWLKIEWFLLSSFHPTMIMCTKINQLRLNNILSRNFLSQIYRFIRYISFILTQVTAFSNILPLHNWTKTHLFSRLK